MEEEKKNIDESWKEAVGKEKGEINGSQEFNPANPDFNFFVTTLSIQASIALGLVPNPATNKTEEDLTQAKFLIDTLDMLKAKTKGNLSEEETNLIENFLYELKVQYIAKNKGGTQT